MYCRVNSIIWFILYFAGKDFLYLALNVILAVKMKSVFAVSNTSISVLSPQMLLRILAISTSVARGSVCLIVLGAVATIWM